MALPLVDELAHWWKERARGLGKPRKSRFRLWAVRPLPKERKDDLQAIVSAGTRLQTLLLTPEWEAVLDVKAFFQNQAQARALIPNDTTRSQFQGAVEWQVIEALFREMKDRVVRGQQAERELRRLLGQ